MALKVGELFASMFLDDSAFRQGLDLAEGRFKSIGKNMTSLGKKSSLLLTAPIVAAGGAMIKTQMNFDTSMSRVQALSGATGAELQSLEDIAKKMGAETSKTASEAADALGYMALAGWDVQSSIEGLEPVLRLSEAGQMDLGRASDLVTDSMAALGLEVSDLDGYLDMVAQTMAKSNTDADQLMQAMLAAGGTFRNLNVPLSEANALLGVLANRGTKGSEAGTALNSIMMNLTTGLGRAGEAMEELNISAFDQDGQFVGMAETLRRVAFATKDMNDEQRNYYLSMIGGKTQVDTLMKLLAGVNEEYAELEGTVRDSDGALMDMSATMRDNLKGDWDEFKSSVEGLMLSFKDELMPILREVLQGATKLARKWSGLSSEQKTTILRTLGLVAVFGPLLIIVGSLFTAIGSIIGVIKALGAFFFITGTAGTAAGAGIGTAAGAATLALNPFALLVAGILAAAGAIIYLRNEFKKWSDMEKEDWTNNMTGSFGMGYGGASGLADWAHNYGKDPEGMGKEATVKSNAQIMAEDARRINSQDFNNMAMQGSYASGTTFVPHDMLAQIHKGEAIIPARLNPFGAGKKGSLGSSQDNEVIHRGTIRVEGYNQIGEYDKVVEIIVEELRRGLLV